MCWGGTACIRCGWPHPPPLTKALLLDVNLTWRDVEFMTFACFMSSVDHVGLHGSLSSPFSGYCRPVPRLTVLGAEQQEEQQQPGSCHSITNKS